jgi:glutamate racemase
LSGKYQKMIGKIFGNNKSVIGKPCPLLVPLVEEGELNTKITEYVLNKYLGKINWSYYDYLILGCTHYSLLMKPITKIIGKKIRLINPSELVANDVKEYLKANRLTKEDTKKSLTKYYITDIINKFADKASMFLGEKIHNHTYQIDIE